MARSLEQAEKRADQLISEQLAIEARLRIAAIVQHSDDAIIGKDMNGIIRDWNNGAKRLYGYSASEVIGKSISILMPPDRVDDFAIIMTTISGGEIIEHFETVRLKKDGTRIDVSLTIFPIIDHAGRITGASTIGRDISERKQQERTLRESEERFRLAAQAGRMLAYEWDPATGKITGSGMVNEILGENVGRQVTFEHMLTLIPAEDRERVVAASAQMSSEKPFLRIRHRMARTDGSLIWVERSSRAYFDENGKMLRTVGMLVDITERVRGEEALRQKDRELLEAQRLAAVGTWYWDVKNDVVTWSEELYRIAGHDPKLPAPSYRETFRHLTSESWERLQRAVAGALQDGTGYDIELEMMRPDATTRWIRTRGEVASDSTGRIVKLRGTAQDITQHKLAEEALATVNRKLIEAQEQERTRIGRELHDDISQRLALLMVEIQQLKEAVPTSPAELWKRMDNLEARAVDISSGIESLSHGLHSSKLEYLGLVLAIKSFCRELGDNHKVEIAFASEGMPASLPPEMSLCLFRVVQEGLHNALKHSDVKLFEVELHGSLTEVHLTVRDSGVGFDPELARGTQGLGLISMQERVRLINGTILVASKPGCGTEISVCVPLAAGKPREQLRTARA